jgi:hypothetical protein
MEKKRRLNKFLPYLLIPLALATALAIVLSREKSDSWIPLTDELRGDQAEEIQTDPKTLELPKKIILEAPFSSQAPFGNWDDPRQQDGCEEMSSLMAARWAKNQPLTSKEAETELFNIAAFEEKRFGTFHDTSAADTEQLIEEYFDLSMVDLSYDVSVDNIKKELAKGNLVLVPANGQRLNNPNFTQPGPERHFLVIRGYDEKNFITNDPGTRKGEAYKYPYSVLLNAIRDYPTGDHLPIEGERKAMIIVSKEN